jgi:hypothetical protein
MDYKYTAIIVEPRKHKALSFVLNNILECLSQEWKIVFFHGINNVEYSKNIVDTLNAVFNNRIQLVSLDVDNLNQKTYSQLLATKSIIYDYIDSEYFLVFQTDSMIFKKNAHLMNEFVNSNYDYIGAPWLVCEYIPTKERDFIGNGGFSLRRTNKMLKIIEHHKWDENHEWHEDLFFSKKYPNIEVIKPDYETAKQFCVDEIYSPITMACHRPWTHSHFSLLSKEYPECETLKSLQYEEE